MRLSAIEIEDLTISSAGGEVLTLLPGGAVTGSQLRKTPPQQAIPVALLFFNIGVQMGQLIFVTAALSLIWILRHAALRLLDAAFVKWAFDRLDGAIAYAIGGVAACWLIERTTAFFV
ncbi:HupE/UreJ family protein [Bradyrhizobium sp.]|uniref:HupE/UreJ family protein n=1 Tax=Bradyrhizobium sp. TaxID=376 RepID=UPI003C3157A7